MLLKVRSVRKALSVEKHVPQQGRYKGCVEDRAVALTPCWVTGLTTPKTSVAPYRARRILP